MKTTVGALTTAELGCVIEMSLWVGESEGEPAEQLVRGVLLEVTHRQEGTTKVVVWPVPDEPNPGGEW